MSAFVANGNTVRIRVSILPFLALLVVGCKRDNEGYNFDSAGEEAQQAMATNVEFVLDEATFHRWERAQANLDKLPPAELDNAPDPGGNDPVVRGIGRLEGSPRAKQAIESAGLSVKNFVLATVALAQAVKASQGGVPPTVGAIASNVRFVLAHASKIRNRGAASVWVPPSELSEEEMAAMRAQQADTIDHSEKIATDAGGRQRNSDQQTSRVLTQPPDVPQRDTTSGNSGSPTPTPPPTNDSLTVVNALEINH